MCLIYLSNNLTSLFIILLLHSIVVEVSTCDGCKTRVVYSSHYRIIKCVGFKPIHFAINLDITSSFKNFSEFESLKLFSLKKNVFKLFK